MAENPMISIATQWFDAFNTHNLEKLLTLYHDNATHYSPKLKMRKPETKGFIVGKKELRDWWSDAFEHLPSLIYVPKRLIADNRCVFMEYERFVEGEETLCVGEVLDVQDGLIVSSRVYHA